MKSASLTEVCDEMYRIATVMGAPFDLLADFGEPHRGGLRIALSDDGALYRLSYSERGCVDLLTESADPSVVLEALFVEVARSWAPSLVATGQAEITPDHLQFLSNMPVEDMREMALKHQVSTGLMQEELLGRINPAWQARQAARNAQRLQHIQDFFEE